MAIKKSFGGASLRKPGSFSKFKVDNTGGSPLNANDTLCIVGESTIGAPGSTDGMVEFNASQGAALVAKYGQGPLVDCALAALFPSATSTIGGAGKIIVYKTNATLQASLNVNEATDSNTLLVLKDREWGVAGNNVSVTIANGVADAARGKIITIAKIGETSEVLDENDAQSQLTVQYTGDASTAVMAITGASKAAKTLTVTLAGDQSDGSLNISQALQNLTMKELADIINGLTGYTGVLVDTAKGTARGATDLDLMSAGNVKAAPVALYRLQEEINDNINENSTYISCALHATPREGLPINISNVFLTGGAQGASSNTNFSDGFAKSLSSDYNTLLPCISQDASDDITLGVTYSGDFVTDGASAYTIASVIAAAKTHLLLRSQIKTRKEAMGVCAFRDSTIANVYAQANTTSSELIQLVTQDVKVVDYEGNLRWKQPHVMAALAAGIRLGTEVGEPLTFKFINATDVGHAIDMALGGDDSEDGDSNPNTDFDDLIDNGILYVEKVAGGFRWVVDNTTYGADESFVFNRGSVMEAVHFISKTMRDTAESVFVGRKISNGAASSIKSVLRNKLIELNEAAITTASEGAPLGFNEDSFVVEIDGNAATVEVLVVPVQGLDWLLISFTIGNIKQSA